jgi:hypothetical protein
MMKSIGSFAGKSAAYVVQGTALGATSFAQGAKEGYVSKSEELKARRAQLTAPAAPVQRKLKAQAA